MTQTDDVQGPERLWLDIDRRGKVSGCPDAHVKPCAEVIDAYTGYVRADLFTTLEAKLAKAVVALDKIKRIDNLVGVFAACERTLAELTGQDDE